MHLIEYYLRLLDQIKEVNTVVSIRLPRVSSILSCTDRNAKKVLAKLTDAGWITWTAGRGRGRISSIRLHISRNDFLIDQAKQVATSQTIDDALGFLHRFSLPHTELQQFFDWLMTDMTRTEASINTTSKDQIILPSYRSFTSLSPLQVHRRSENHVMKHLYNCLVRYDERTEQFSPDLAHHWHAQNNNKQWTFYLRKDVQFHSGKEMTAKDVQESLLQHKRIKESPYHWAFKDMDTIETLSRYVVRITFESSQPHLLHIAASLGAAITPVERSSLPVGTGPFEVTSFTDKKFIMHAFSKHFHTRPLLDMVGMFFYPELYNYPSAQHFNEKDVPLNFYHYPYYERVDDRLESYEKVDRGSKLLTLNMNTGTLANDDLLREAICHLLPVSSLLERYQGKRFSKAERMVQEFEKDTFARSETRGARLLQQSKYSGETLQLYTYAGAGNEADAQLIIDHLFKYGIRMRLRVLPYDQFHREHAGADLLLGENLFLESPLFTYMMAFLSSQSILNTHLPEDILHDVKQALQSTDALNKLLHIERNLLSQYTHVHLYRLTQYAFYPKNLHGVEMNTLGWVDYRKLWYDIGGFE
ncbi:ABC transporter substrate-binding protein [Geomicrobium sp. JSM 1781026]|uniref:ABC transporter substrate-binding protein n=1 Tax=Geomicrobium sp. JSM 1781026 TaxID=3344580 RepID=UPI0035C07595